MENNSKINIQSVSIQELLESDITYQNIPTPIDTIISRLESGYYCIPKYQRNYIWDEKQIVALIVSLLKDIPIPRLYMYNNLKDGKYTIIDGQQRLTSLFFFVKGVYPISQNRKSFYDFEKISKIVEKISVTEDKKEIIILKRELKDEHDLKIKDFEIEISENKVGKLNYRDFSLEEKLKFNNKTLDFGVVFVKEKKTSSKDVNYIYTDIFRLLNSAGTPLSNQEIRNGIYFNTELYLNINKFNEENIYWNRIKKEKDNRHQNVEFLLRLLSLNKYIKVFSKEKISEISEKKSNENLELEELKCVLKLEDFTTYSELIDKYSEEYSKKDIQKIEEEIKKLDLFFSSIEIPENNKKSINILNIEAFFLAASKMDLINKKLKISEDIIMEKINSNAKTSSKKEIFKRIIQAIKILKDVGEEKIEE